MKFPYISFQFCKIVSVIQLFLRSYFRNNWVSKNMNYSYFNQTSLNKFSWNLALIFKVISTIKFGELVHFSMLPCPFLCYVFILFGSISVVACFLLFKNKKSEVFLRCIFGCTKKLFYDEISFWLKSWYWYKINFLYLHNKASKWPLVAMLT